MAQYWIIWGNMKNMKILENMKKFVKNEIYLLNNYIRQISMGVSGITLCCICNKEHKPSIF
jgi:hypothetical protein